MTALFKQAQRSLPVAFAQVGFTVLLAGAAVAGLARAQAPPLRDPAEPQGGKPQAKILPRPAGRLARTSVDEKGMRALISDLVDCGTRLTIASWDDPKRGPGCARDHLVRRVGAIRKASGGGMAKFVGTSPTGAQRQPPRHGPP